MKIRTFVVGYVLALALLVFANRHSEVATSSTFRTVIDLTAVSSGGSLQRAALVQNAHAAEPGITRIESPASYSPELWSVDQIPGQRLVAPLAVLDVHGDVDMNDVVNYERTQGHIPQGAVVLVRPMRDGDHRLPAFSGDATRFLLHARNVIGLGVEAPEMRHSESETYALSHSAYLLTNVVNLDKVPASGSMVMVAPSKLRGKATGPVRVLALVR